MAVPNIFGTATAAIPLSQLDTNFATAITLGNTAVYLGNTTTSLGNVTLTNVTISSGNVTLTGANVSGTANVSTLVVTGNQTSLGNVAITGNISANIVTVAAGAVGTPSITTTGDTNTGIFFPAADTIAFSEGGVESMRIDSAGNVGIGTSSPTGKLNVVTDNTHNGGATFDSTGTTQIWMRDTNSTANTKNWGFQISGGDFNILRANDDRATGFVTPVSFAQAPANSLIIDVSGNVGMGTASPNRTGFTAPVLSITNGTSGIIELIGTQTADGTIGQIAFYNTSSSVRIAQILGLRSGANNSGALTFQTNNAGTLGEAGRFDSSGNLGIGTTSPASVAGFKLIEVQGSTGGIFQASASGNSVKARFYSTNIQGYAGTTSNHPFAFLTNDIERVTIDTSGYLLVGTTSTLNASKMGYQFDGNAGYRGLFSNNNTGGAATHMGFYTSGTSYGSISSNTTGTGFNTTSDYRLKNTIAPMTGALAKVALLNPCTYKWNADGSDGQGFIAHELAEVCPQAVTGEKDAVDAEGKPVYQGVDTSFLVATLTAAIQEQQAIITQLTTRITALEGA
jgi:hypothetical protein